jgi:arginase
MRLLLPEWQGCGVSSEVAAGARVLAREWWSGQDVTSVEAPQDEILEIGERVVGLASMAPRAGETLSRLSEFGPERLQMIGGTCGVEVAPVAYLNERYAGDLAVIWIDGHADLNTPQTSPSGHFHGMVLRTLLGDGPEALSRQIARPLKPEQVFLVGPRDMDPAELDYMRSRPVTWMRDEAFVSPQRLTETIAAKGFSRVYIHFDVDVVNPADFGNALMRADGGPVLPEVADLLSHLHRHTDVMGFSVLEYCDRTAADRERLLTVLRAIDVNSCCG